MRTNGATVDAATLAKLEQKHLEAAWRRAWETRAHAAQTGNYAEAERWHKRATLLGSQLVAADHALAALNQPLAHAR